MFETQEKLSLATEISVGEDVLLDNLQPIERFLMGLNAPETKRQYPKRLESFFDFLQLRGSFEDKTITFCRMVIVENNNGEWLTNQLLKFLRYQKERVSKREIEEATVSNYFKAINTEYSN